MSLRATSAPQRTERPPSSLRHIGDGWRAPLIFPVLSLYFPLFCHFSLFVFPSSHLSPFHSLPTVFLPILFHLFPSMPLCPLRHTSSLISVFHISVFHLSPYCSLLPHISSILTPLMTLRLFHPADYAKGFGGQYGIQKDRVDKVKLQNTNVLRRVP